MRVFLITLFLLLCVTSGAIAQTVPAKVDELKVIATPGQIAPHPSVIGAEAELALTDIYGVERKLSDLRGRVVVLNQYAALGVQVVGASLDTPAERKAVRKFITNLKINFPIWLGATTKDLARFGFGPAIPSTAIIGRDGKIVAVFRGAINQATLKKQLDALIVQSHTRS